MASTESRTQLRSRHSFGRAVLQVPYPDFLEIQIKSFKEFFQLETTPDKRINEGLFKVFKENFPISDARNSSSLIITLTLPAIPSMSAVRGV